MMQATAIYRPRSSAGQFVSVRITPAVRQSVEEVTQMVFDRSQQLVPVDTGALKASGSMQIEDLDATIRGTGSYSAEYAPYVEFGTGIAGAASAGAGPGPYSPDWPGMPAQPFQRPAVDEVKPQADEIFRHNIGVAISG